MPTYVLPLPEDINRFICTFLPHPDTDTRNLRARHVIEHLHQKVVQLMFELDMLEGMQEHIYEEEEGVFAMQPLLLLITRLKVYFNSIGNAPLASSILS